MKVLIVDDSRDIAYLFRDFLELRGDCSVSVAFSGEEALTAVKSNKPDLIILDMVLPGLKGMEVIEALRKTAETSGIPVILASAIEEAPEKEEQRRLGVIEFIQKPINFKLLSSKVGDIVNRLN